MKSFPTLEPLLEMMEQHHASDLYLTVGCPASIRIEGAIVAVNEKEISSADIEEFIQEILTDEQHATFRGVLEFNTAIHLNNNARFRANVLRQQMQDAIVIRRIQTVIPSLDSLGLPPLCNEVIMQPRGLIIIVGGTGSGKSTTLASMVEHRNTYGQGHIVTIEDPIEFTHSHKQCIITQRELGIDTYSYGSALKNALRQRPDVVLIGEIRDAETMEHALNFSETGHLVLSTLHANNANQAIERILNFFPKEQRCQIARNLSLNLKVIFAQRLVENTQKKKSLALEVLRNEGAITSLIEESEIRKIKEIMERSEDQGMQSFDQHLLRMLHAGEITESTAITQSDNPANIRLKIRQSLGESHAKQLQIKGNDSNF